MSAIKGEKTRCQYFCTGPKVGRNVVLWRRPCSRWAIAGQLYCWQHAEGKTR